MPRRNNRRHSLRRDHEWINPESTFEDIARDLVKAGICSSGILDHPYNWRKDTTS